MRSEEQLIKDLRTRAELRRKIRNVTSDRIADLCEEAANMIENLSENLRVETEEHSTTIQRLARNDS